MPDPAHHRFALAGRVFEVAPMGFDEQLEVECIMLRTFGPAAGAALRVAAGGIIPMFVDLLREMAGKGERFDLENLVSYWNAFIASEDGTRDPRLRQVWDDFTGVLADTGGEIVQTAAASLAMRVSVEDVRRLFDIVLLKKQRTFLVTADKPVVVADFGTMERLLDRQPAAKWVMLTEGLKATYLRAVDHDEKDDQGDA